ncbi:hypothetical protein Sjap_001483 [Stephania japonica]|uniref:Phytol kinase n=1 Tax=Stephania japonica TaxID=461633 RepID=A0AAP0KK06_9MAGN
MLFWPFFSSHTRAAVFASLIPGINIIRMLLMGLGIWKDDATVKSFSRNGDYRELLRGPFCYACSLTFSTLYWRTSPIAIASVCNMCAGDGVADMVGRKFGTRKLPYNKSKSYAGSIAMAAVGFVASLAFMLYFSFFGFIQESWTVVLGFLITSLTSALVESLPIHSVIDDNITVVLASVVVGELVF